MSDIYSTIQPKSTFTPFQLKYWEDLINKQVNYHFIKNKVELSDKELPKGHRHYLGTKKRAEKVEVLEHFLAQMKTVSLLTGESVGAPDVMEMFQYKLSDKKDGFTSFEKSVFDSLYKSLGGK